MEIEPKNQSRWLDVKKAASHLGTSVSFVRNLIWDGSVPYVRAGKKFVVDQADLDAWMIRNKERNLT
jgi:excisionase family DNA binding protein